jgi:hypothetical protein
MLLREAQVIIEMAASTTWPLLSIGEAGTHDGTLTNTPRQAGLILWVLSAAFMLYFVAGTK